MSLSLTLTPIRIFCKKALASKQSAGSDYTCHHVVAGKTIIGSYINGILGDSVEQMLV